MMKSRGRAPAAVIGLVGLAALSCINDDAVFTSLRSFEDPPAAAQGFLGYATGTAERRPICGNCHVGKAADWRQTRHASAWSTLQESGLAQETCEPCHTVGANGNVVVESQVAWASTRDPRYQDVQCESCHGPGLDHVTNPDAFQPLPPLEVGIDLTRGCGECHSGTHQPFVEEWTQSRHGNMNPAPQQQAACVQCHEARGIFKAWGIRADYLEKEQAAPIPITCGVCHDPHDATNSHQLRFGIDEPNEDTNLCMKCHFRGGIPDPALTTEPHSPQGPLLLGIAGWRPPGFTFADDTIVGTHGTSRNPRMCATCHVNRLEVTDAQTGAFVFDATGHLFQAIPCLDDEGKPTRAQDCDVSDRSFVGCTPSGCHGSSGAAEAAFVVVQSRIQTLVSSLDALLAQLPVSEFNPTDGRLTTAEGARFNAQLAALRGSAVHNPFLIESLLTASIDEVEMEYGLVAGAFPSRHSDMR